MRTGSILAVGLAVVVGGLSACSGSSGVAQPSSVTAPAAMSREKLLVSVKVTNTHFGNAIPSDFRVTVSYDGSVPASATVNGSETPVEVSVPRSSNYTVNVATLEGYTTVLSAGCAGTATRDTVTCQVTASDVEVTCDEALWGPVYLKDRLRVLAKCKVATGTVVGTEVEHDGDLEVWLTPDDRYTKLMRPGNVRSHHSLVVEIPCQEPITQPDARGTCDQYTGPRIAVPLPGEHLVVAAPWVEDKGHHHWAELHGARVVKLPR